LNISTFDYSGPYEIYVTGLAADGTPTTSVEEAQQPFFLQPYLYYTGNGSSPATGPQIAFDDTEVPTAGLLSGDLFIGSNIISGGNITITDSQVRGNVTISDSNVTLVGVNGGDFNVTGSVLTLKDSSVGALRLDNSSVTLLDSSYSTVTPALPVISVVGLSKPIGGIGNYNVTIYGSGFASSYLSAWIDGSKIDLKAPVLTGSNLEIPTNVTIGGTIDAFDLNDGVHTLTITVFQSDGLSSTLAASFSTDVHQLSLQSQTTTLFYLVYSLVLLFVVALAIGIYALRRGGGQKSSTPLAAPHV
jgi:hypothetical protein